MQKVTLTIRVDAEDLEKWQKQAGERKLSAWIRERLNEANGEDLRRASGVRVARRGVAASGGFKPAEHNATEKLSPHPAVEVCAHGAAFAFCKQWGCKFHEVANGRGAK